MSFRPYKELNMKPMDSPEQLGIMAKIRNSRGFSLIEMAIVLVIIGLIIGAVIKGQDLILNSRAKQVNSAVTTWRNLAAAYLDRNGRLPGDSVRDGVIGNDAAEQTATTSATYEITNSMSNTPPNPVIVGGMSFWVYFGNVAGSSLFRNVLIICKDVACANVFTADELEIIKTIDTAIDGSADAGLGQFRAVTAAPTLVGSLAAFQSRDQDVLTAGTVVNVTALGTTIDWAVTHRAAVWSFDRPF